MFRRSRRAVLSISLALFSIVIAGCSNETLHVRASQLRVTSTNANNFRSSFAAVSVNTAINQDEPDPACGLLSKAAVSAAFGAPVDSMMKGATPNGSGETCSYSQQEDQAPTLVIFLYKRMSADEFRDHPWDPGTSASQLCAIGYCDSSWSVSGVGDQNEGWSFLGQGDLAFRKGSSAVALEFSAPQSLPEYAVQTRVVTLAKEIAQKVAS